MDIQFVSRFKDAFVLLRKNPLLPLPMIVASGFSTFLILLFFLVTGLGHLFVTLTTALAKLPSEQLNAMISHYFTLEANGFTKLSTFLNAVLAPQGLHVPSLSTLAVYAAFFAVLVITSGLLYFYARNMTYTMIHLAQHNDALTFDKVLRASHERLGPFLLQRVLVTVLRWLPLIVFGLIGLLFLAFTLDPLFFFILVLFYSFVSLLYFFYLLFLAIFIYFSIPALYREQCSALKSLQFAYRIARKKTLATFVVLLILYVLHEAVVEIFNFPLRYLFGSFFTGSLFVVGVSGFAFVLVSCLTALVWVFIAAYQFTLYEDFRYVVPFVKKSNKRLKNGLKDGLKIELNKGMKKRLKKGFSLLPPKKRRR